MVKKMQLVRWHMWWSSFSVDHNVEKHSFFPLAILTDNGCLRAGAKPRMRDCVLAAISKIVNKSNAFSYKSADDGGHLGVRGNAAEWDLMIDTK